MPQTQQKASKAKPVKKQKSNDNKNPLKIVLISAGVGIAVFFVCLAIFSYILTSFSDPDRYIPVLALAGIIISGGACGIVCKAIGCTSALYPAISGLVMIVIFLAISVFAGTESESDTIYKTLIAAGAPVASVIMCNLSKSKKKKKSR